MYLDKAEKYFPASFEYAFRHLVRTKVGDEYWLKSKAPLRGPSDVLDFFHGEGGAIASGEGVPAYAFISCPTATGGEGLEIRYFFYFPYNRGKSALDTVFESHVGDWEQASIRFDANGKPWHVYVSAHDFGCVYRFSDGAFLGCAGNNLDRSLSGSVLEFESGPDTRRPVLYAAWGSHGLWAQPGRHAYRDLGVVTLEDSASKGFRWDTGKKLVVYDHDNEAAWPSWMTDSKRDCLQKGCDPSDPWSGGIERWGNQEEECEVIAPSGSIVGWLIKKTPIHLCRLSDGPKGPVDKDWTGQWFAGLRIPDQSSYVTEVTVIRGSLDCPEGFEGLRFDAATRAKDGADLASDVNKGMGGDLVGICVKYTPVAEGVTSDRGILVDIQAKRFGKHWEPSCPPGWNEVGRLTTHTRGACDRMGLCAHYAALSELDDASHRPAFSLGLSHRETGVCPVDTPLIRGENIQTRSLSCGGLAVFLCRD